MGMSRDEPRRPARERATDVVATPGGRRGQSPPAVVQVLFACLVLITAGFALTRIPVLRAALPWWATGGMIIVVHLLAALVTALRALLVRGQRLTWWMFAAGLAGYSCADIYSWSVTHGVSALPFPSVGDVAWLMLYPLACVGLVALILAQLRHSHTQVLLDGVVAGLGAAACLSAVVIEALFTAPPAGSPAAVAAAFGYPVGDAVLLGMALCLFVVGDWASRRELSVLVASLVVFTAVDSSYIAAASRGAYRPGDPLDLGYLIALTLVAVAAWRKHRAATAQQSEWVPIGLPITFAVSSIVLMLVATRIPISPVPIVFAALALLTVVVRTVVSFRQIQRMALHDVLTGLPNRALVMDRIERMLTRGRRTGEGGACLHLDLDGFKQVNDTLGHAAGDHLLRAVSDRLGASVRSSDTVGRMGGDEFVVLIDGRLPNFAPEIVAERMLHVLRQPFDLDAAAEPIMISGSIGIAVGDRPTADQLLHDADMALYQAKAAGRDCLRFFQPDAGEGTRHAEPVPDVHAALER
jgi:diguanylate cyclase (GGDEF)-like protein